MLGGLLLALLWAGLLATFLRCPNEPLGAALMPHRFPRAKKLLAPVWHSVGLGPGTTREEKRVTEPKLDIAQMPFERTLAELEHITRRPFRPRPSSRPRRGGCDPGGDQSLADKPTAAIRMTTGSPNPAQRFLRCEHASQHQGQDREDRTISARGRPHANSATALARMPATARILLVITPCL
jgi:hypothetical protein